MEPIQMEHIKIVALADVDVERQKTRLLASYGQNCLPRDVIPDVFDNYSPKPFEVNGKPISLELWNAPGKLEYDQIRPMTYYGTDAFIIFFSRADHTSFKQVKTKWYPEVRRFESESKAKSEVKSESEVHIPILLVGLNQDYWDYPDVVVNPMPLITYRQGTLMAEKIKAVKYVECSTSELHGITSVIQCAVQSVLFPNYSQHPTQIPRLC